MAEMFSEIMLSKNGSSFCTFPFKNEQSKKDRVIYYICIIYMIQIVILYSFKHCNVVKLLNDKEELNEISH